MVALEIRLDETRVGQRLGGHLNSSVQALFELRARRALAAAKRSAARAFWRMPRRSGSASFLGLSSVFPPDPIGWGATWCPFGVRLGAGMSEVGVLKWGPSLPKQGVLKWGPSQESADSGRDAGQWPFRAP